MATNFTLTAALLMALLSMAAAASLTTTIITTDEDSNPQHQQCRQMVQGRQFRACQTYIKQRGPYQEEEEEQVIEMSTGREHLQECCQQLREMDRRHCGCQAVQHALSQAQESGLPYVAGESERIYRRARELPRVCGLRQQRCSFRIVFL